MFVLANSVAALSGLLLTRQDLSLDIFWMVLAAMFGSMVGGIWVSDAVKPRTLYYILGLVLIVAGLKLILTV